MSKYIIAQLIIALAACSSSPSNTTSRSSAEAESQAQSRSRSGAGTDQKELLLIMPCQQVNISIDSKQSKPQSQTCIDRKTPGDINTDSLFKK